MKTVIYVICLLMLVGCASTGGQSDYQAYTVAMRDIAMQPRDYAVQKISGATEIIFKGTDLTFETRAEHKNSPITGGMLSRPKSGAELFAESIDKLLPIAAKTAIAYWGFDSLNKNQELLAKSPVIVPQNNTVTTNTVLPVNQQEVVTVPEIQVVEVPGEVIVIDQPVIQEPFVLDPYIVEVPAVEVTP